MGGHMIQDNSSFTKDDRLTLTAAELGQEVEQRYSGDAANTELKENKRDAVTRIVQFILNFIRVRK